MNVVRPSAVLRRQVTVNFFAFDLLVEGSSLMSAPYLDRRAALAELVPAHGAGLPVQAPPHWLGLSADTMLGVARETGMEGCVFKKISSIYLPGRRTRSWVKTLVRQRMSAVVIGWIAGGGAQRNVVGSLVLGAFDPDGVLQYIGQVGTGFTASMRRQLRDQLEQLERPTSPLPALSTRTDAPHGVHWVEPHGRRHRIPRAQQGRRSETFLVQRPPIGYRAGGRHMGFIAVAAQSRRRAFTPVIHILGITRSAWSADHPGHAARISVRRDQG